MLGVVCTAGIAASLPSEALLALNGSLACGDGAVCVCTQDAVAASVNFGPGSIGSMHGRYGSQGGGAAGVLLDPGMSPDALAVTLAAKRAALIERESALQVRVVKAA
jgi:hypothetical protein